MLFVIGNTLPYETMAMDPLRGIDYRYLLELLDEGMVIYHSPTMPR